MPTMKRSAAAAAAAADDASASNKRARVGDVVTLRSGRVARLTASDAHTERWELEGGVRSLQDLLALDELYESHADKHKRPNLPFAAIRRAAPALRTLEDMVGLPDAKKRVLQLVLFALQRLDGARNRDMLHTVVYGAPGVGKTRFVRALAEVYAALGVLPSAKVTSVKRADMVGQYLGHTAAKTRKVLNEARGGVLLIDEAYALGDAEGRDSFSKECLDVLNQTLSEDKEDLVCVIAGYREDLDERFFASNPGLERRFPIRIAIDDYTPAQLRDIFARIVGEAGWALAPDAAPVNLFEKHKFEYNGGDMETLFVSAKWAHAMRVFGAGDDVAKKELSRDDVQAALDAFQTHAKTRKSGGKFADAPSHLYL